MTDPANQSNVGPDWFDAAKGLAMAIMFQRTMRSEHTVGRDGRARMGMVNLFGCYAVDTAAREFCEMAGLPFGNVEAPNEHQAFFMAVTGRQWSDWFTDREVILAEAGKGPGRGKVDMKLAEKAIKARATPDGDTA